MLTELYRLVSAGSSKTTYPILTTGPLLIELVRQFWPTDILSCQKNRFSKVVKWRKARSSTVFKYNFARKICYNELFSRKGLIVTNFPRKVVFNDRYWYVST